MLMRIMRWAIAGLTALTIVAFAVVVITTSLSTDKTIPVLTVEEGTLEVSVNATDEELLQGVTAYDGKDGDITSNVLIESISKFSEIGYCKATYAVCDSDNHVTTAIRQIHYTDYEAPTFSLNRSLVFSINEKFDILGIVDANDCLDGDISQNVIVYSPDFKENETGDFTLQATVTNSKGDTSTIELPMTVESIVSSGTKVILSDYLVYRKAGDPVPNWADYIVETIDSNGIDTDLSISVKTDFDNKKPGTYVVNYYSSDSTKHIDHTALIVIVE